MIKVSNNYKQQMLKPIRNRGYASVSLGIINQMAQKNADVTSSILSFSKGDIFLSLKSPVTYATLEQDFFKCDGSLLFPPESTNSRINDTLNARDNGVVGSELLGPITITFNDVYNIKGLTIDFGDYYPTAFKIESEQHTYTYSDNNVSKWSTQDLFGETSYITVMPIIMKNNNLRLRIRNFVCGVGLTFENENSCEMSDESFVSDISSEVSYRNFKAVVFDTEGKFDVDNDDSFMSFLEPGQKFTMNFGIELDNGNIEWYQKGSAYLKDWSLSNRQLTLNGTDRLSTFENKYIKGNKVYERTAYQECKNIFDDLGLQEDEYYIDTYLQEVTLKNPLPELTHREALQVICNATRCIVFEDSKGIINIKGNFSNVLDPDDITVTSNSLTEWSQPGNIFSEVNAVYADMSSNLTSADGTVFFLPTDRNYLKTGYVSGSIANEDGTFDVNPYIDIDLHATFSYYGVSVDFGDNVPDKIYLKAYLNDNLIATYVETDISQENTFLREFTNFNRLRIEVEKTKPNCRVLINKVSFGNASDFKLTKELITDNPDTFKESRTKDIWVKIYTFNTDSDGKTIQINDNKYIVATLNPDGETHYCENQLIHTREQAELVAEWLTTYYKNNVNYDISYRGDLRIEAGDIIGLDSDYVNNLQVIVEKASLSFNGGYSGSLDLRRYQNHEPEKLEYIEIPVSDSSLENRVAAVEGSVSELSDDVEGLQTTKQDANTAINTSNIGNQTVFRATRLGGEESQNELVARSYAGTPIEGYSSTFFQQDLTNKCVNIGINGAGAVGVNRAKIADSATTAGSCTGNAATATALQSKSVGSANQPVYFDADGKPVACTTYANASVKSAGSATKATQDGNGVTIAGTYLKRKEITLSNKKLTANTNNEFTYTKTGGTVVGACFKQCWPKTTWTNAVCSIVQCSTDGALTITTMATQNYDMVVCILYV